MDALWNGYVRPILGTDKLLIVRGETRYCALVSDLPASESQSSDISAAWPIGSIYISAVATNPSSLLGFGTWEAFGAGRVLVGHDPADADFDAAEKAGGSKTVAASGSVSAPTFTGSSANTSAVSAGTPAGSVSQPTFTGDAVSLTHSGTAVQDHAAHTHSVTSNVAVADHASHTHTYTEVPNHTHPHNLQGSTTAATTGTNVMASTATGGSSRAMAIATGNPTGGVATGTTAGPSATLSHSVTNNAVTSGSPSATLTHSVTQPSAHSHTPTGSVSTPSFTGSALGAHQHSVTAAGTVSAPSFTGSETSVVQPYITVHLWRRAA